MSLQVWRMLQKPLCGNQMNLATLKIGHLAEGKASVLSGNPNSYDMIYPGWLIEIPSIIYQGENTSYMMDDLLVCVSYNTPIKVIWVYFYV